MFRYFRFPVDFENFVYLSQVQQGLAIKTAVTHWRSLKPHCMGTLIWQLNDTWPVCSWSSLDHGGGWKLLHHMARAFYAPIFVSAVPVRDGFELRAVNDGAETIQLTVAAHAVAMDGETRPLGSATVRLGPDAAVLALNVPGYQVSASEMLAYTWSRDGYPIGGDVFAPKPYKTYDLLPSKLSTSIVQSGDSYEITTFSQSLALFVSIEADQPGRFSTNAVSLFPGHPATLIFTPQRPGQEPLFVLRDLHSATYGPTERT
jgi:beta-mannosidase